MHKNSIFLDILLIVILNVGLAFCSLKLNLFEQFFESINGYLEQFGSLEQFIPIVFLLMSSLVYFVLRRWWENRQYALHVEQNASRDPLTKLLNRRSIECNLIAERERFLRYHENFSVILFDIDDFHEINKNLGNLEGDRILIDISNLLQNNTRKTDCVARWGEEEFLILCPVCNREQAVILAEKLRAGLFRTLKDGIELSASFAVTQSNETESLEALLKRVNLTLYKAKQRGKNCVLVG